MWAPPTTTAIFMSWALIITNINKHIRSYVYVPRIRNQPAESAREEYEIEAKTAKKGRIKGGKEKKERNRRTPKGNYRLSVSVKA